MVNPHIYINRREIENVIHDQNILYDIILIVSPHQDWFSATTKNAGIYMKGHNKYFGLHEIQNN